MHFLASHSQGQVVEHTTPTDTEDNEPTGTHRYPSTTQRSGLCSINRAFQACCSRPGSTSKRDQPPSSKNPVQVRAQRNERTRMLGDSN